MVVGGMMSWPWHSLSCRRTKHHERRHQLSEDWCPFATEWSFYGTFQRLRQYFGPGTDYLHYDYLMNPSRSGMWNTFMCRVDKICLKSMIVLRFSITGPVICVVISLSSPATYILLPRGEDNFCWTSIRLYRNIDTR